MRKHHNIEHGVFVVSISDECQGRCDIDLVESWVATSKRLATKLADEAVDGYSMTAMVVAQTLGNIAGCSKCAGEHTQAECCVVGINGVVFKRCSGAQQHDVSDFHIGKPFGFGHDADCSDVVVFFNPGLLAARCQQDASGTGATESQH